MSGDLARQVVFNRAGHRCQIRRSGCEVVATEIDHIWPRYWGGQDTLDNYQAACGRCNRSKGHRVLFGAAESHQIMSAVWASSDRAVAMLEECTKVAQYVALDALDIMLLRTTVERIGLHVRILERIVAVKQERLPIADRAFVVAEECFA